MVLGFIVIHVQAEALRTCPLTRDLHVPPVVKGHQLECDLCLIDAGFATRVFGIFHGRGDPRVTAEEAKHPAALAGLLRIHGFVEHEDPAIHTALAVHVAQELLLFIEGPQGRKVFRCLEDIPQDKYFGADGASCLELLDDKILLEILSAHPRAAYFDTGRVRFQAIGAISRACRQFF